MGSKRTPIGRDLKRRITPEVISTFRLIEKLDVTSDAWWALHMRLHGLLGAKPWQFPVACPPDSTEFPAHEANVVWGELKAISTAAPRRP